jgi:cell division protein FtsN
MSVKRTSGALMTSVIVHLIVMLLVGVYFVTQTEKFQDVVGLQFSKPTKPPKPKVRKPIVKKIYKTDSSNGPNCCR